VIKFVGDLRQFDGFLLVLRFTPPIKLTHHDITEILLKVVLNTIAKPNLSIFIHTYIMHIFKTSKSGHFLVCMVIIQYV
jgi:hypothetical protein